MMKDLIFFSMRLNEVVFEKNVQVEIELQTSH